MTSAIIKGSRVRVQFTDSKRDGLENKTTQTKSETLSAKRVNGCFSREWGLAIAVGWASEGDESGFMVQRGFGLMGLERRRLSAGE